LQALAEPQQRGAAAVAARRRLDQPRRHAGLPLAPGGRAFGQSRLDLVPADAVAGKERAVEQALAVDYMQHREGERRVAAGERLQMEVGGLGRPMAHGVDHDLGAARLLEPVLVSVRARGGRIDAPSSRQAASRALRGRTW
jgi:hypothetical protein